jgi:hypothetical protein
MSQLGQSRPSQSALKSAFVRYASNSDQISRLGEMTLSAISDQRTAANYPAPVPANDRGGDAHYCAPAEIRTGPIQPYSHLEYVTALRYILAAL